MHVSRHSWLWILPILFVSIAGSTASTAIAAEATQPLTPKTPFDMPEFKAGDQAGIMSTTIAPWLSQEERYYHSDKNVFWNQNFRGGIGQARINACEYLLYDYNNLTIGDTDDGEIREIHHTLTLMGAPIPNVRLYVTVGVNTISIDRGTVSGDLFTTLQGLTYELGVELGFPIDIVTIMGRFFWRQWEASKGGDIDALSTQWNGAILVSVELFGSRDSFALNVYAGFGYHYIYQRWDMGAGGAIEHITPDNSASQDNGPERFDVIVGVNAQPLEWLSFNFEARLLGPLSLIAGLSFIF